MKKKVKTFLVNGKKVIGRQCNVCYTKYHPSTKHNLTCKGPPELVTDENRDRYCALCRKFYPTKDLLRSHIKNLHPEEFKRLQKEASKPKPKPKPELNEKCDICDKPLKNKDTVHKHTQLFHPEAWEKTLLKNTPG